jgi:hypothetical protein
MLCRTQVYATSWDIIIHFYFYLAHFHILCIADLSAAFFLLWQESLLQDEIQKLKDEINNLTNYIESRKSESSKLEAALANKQKDHNDFVKQKNALQDERKYAHFLAFITLWFDWRCVALDFMYVMPQIILEGGK